MIYSKYEIHIFGMVPKIVSISQRGQITLPKPARTILGSEHLICRLDGKKVILEPLQTREDFIRELEDAEKDWTAHGGLTIEEMRVKYDLPS